MTTEQAVYLRAAATYAVRLGLMPGLESEILDALVTLNEDHGLPKQTHDGWEFTMPVPPPPGESKARFIETGGGGNFG